MKFKLEMYNELDTRRDPRGHLHENSPFAKTRPLALGRTICMRVIYIIHDVYIIYEQHAPGNVVLHGEIVKIPLEIFFF